MIYLQKFYKVKIDVDNIVKYVLSFRKVYFRNWDCIFLEVVDNKNYVLLLFFSLFMVEEDIEVRIEDLFNLDDVEVKILKGDGLYIEEIWVKIIGISYESVSNKFILY